MTFEYSQKVVNKLEKLLETNEGCDVIIYAVKMRKKAHSSIYLTYKITMNPNILLWKGLFKDT